MIGNNVHDILQYDDYKRNALPGRTNGPRSQIVPVQINQIGKRFERFE